MESLLLRTLITSRYASFGLQAYIFADNPVLILPLLQTWKALEKLLPTGKVKAIGVSNFSKAEMEHLLKSTSVVPAAHQLESHPWLQQRDFVDWHKSKGIHVTHYSPFGNQNELYSKRGTIGKLIDDPVLAEIGKKYNKSAAQVALGMLLGIGPSRM